MATSSEERILINTYKQKGSEIAFEELVKRYMPLVHGAARKFENRGIPYMDLVQVAAIGFTKALKNFDPERGVALSTYAVPTMVGELKRYFRDSATGPKVPRGTKELALRADRAIQELSTQGHSPTMNEVADYLEVDLAQVEEALLSRIGVVSFDSADDYDSDDPRNLHESVGLDDQNLLISDEWAFLGPLLAGLSERDREVLFQRFFLGKTQTGIAEEIGVSQMHVSRLIRRALRRIREGMEQQVLGLIQGQPGITRRELEETTGLNGELNLLLKNLRSKNKISEQPNSSGCEAFYPENRRAVAY